MPQPAPSPQGGFFSNVFSALKGVFTYVLENKVKVITYFVLFTLLMNIVKVYNEPISNDEKFEKAFVKTLSSVLAADLHIYQETDNLFNPTNNVFDDYSKAQGLKYKVIGIWNITKGIFNLLQYVIFLAYFFIVYLIVIQILIGKFNVPMLYMLLLLALCTLPMLIATNAIINQETTDESNFVYFIGKYVPLRGVAHLGYTVFHLASDPAYNLVTRNFPTTENVPYYNETGITTI